MAATPDFVRLMVCGSVDDGKSTLLGRLLHETGSLTDDQLANLGVLSRRYGSVGDALDYALVLDGLEAEREQGITIDVAWRRLTAGPRTFLIADVPGHEQFTRNMATGAASADAAILLVDAMKGLTRQSRRHAQIASLFGVRQIALAVNKMDLARFAENRFQAIAAAFREFAGRLGIESVTAIPVAAASGENIAARSAKMSWYRGPSVLEYLESIRVPSQTGQPFRMPVQLVLREGGARTYAGIVASGAVATGDEVLAARSGRRTRISGFAERDGKRSRAVAGDSVALLLADELDIGRGDLLASPQVAPHVADQFAAHILWFDDKELFPERGYLLKAGEMVVPAAVTAVRYRIDPDDLSERAARTLGMNEIGHCHIMTATPVAFDSYRENRETGAFILIDRDTKMTVGTGLIEHPLRRASNVHAQAFEIDRAARARAKGQSPCVVWFTGLPGSGKSTIANEVERRLHAAGFHTYILDGDNLRQGLTKDLGFTETDRIENVRRAAEVAALMADAGLIVLCCFVSPFAAERRAIRERIGSEMFLEAFVDTPLEVCIARDPKGLYAKSRSGEAQNVTGIDQRYEPPEAPELRLTTTDHSVEELAEEVLALLRRHVLLQRTLHDVGAGGVGEIDQIDRERNGSAERK